MYRHNCTRYSGRNEAERDLEDGREERRTPTKLSIQQRVESARERGSHGYTAIYTLSYTVISWVNSTIPN